MARPMSMDLRERVARFVEAGGGRRGAATHFSVSPSFVVKLMQRNEATGSLAPAAMGGMKRHALADHSELVRELVAAEPDMTLDELKGQLVEHGLSVSRSSIWRFLDGLGLTRKKRHSMRANRNGPTSRPRGASGIATSRG
jgi:transposase